MLFLKAAEIDALAPMPRVVERLREAFRGDGAAPDRQLVPVPGAAGDRLCLVMPAFDASGAGMVKLSTVFPDNRGQARPTIQGVIVAFSDTGAPVAMLDGAAVTRRRTAAASALASSYLSRPDSTRLLLVGTGDLAPSMVEAHCAVRPVRHVSVWGRDKDAAKATAAAVRARLDAGIEVTVCTSLEQDAAAADIVACATSSAKPVLLGRWLKAGSFVDLVGSFSPDRREADDEAILRSRVFVDTWAGALAEAGDLLHPLARQVISRAHLLGDLADLVQGRVVGRAQPSDITLFKSVGAAIEDLALAQLVIEAFAEKAGTRPTPPRDPSPEKECCA